jgi:Zn-dependent protease
MNWELAILNVSLLWMLTAPHEFAHAWTAVRLGDDTPRKEGRLTLHPLAHVDWLGTLILPFITSLMVGGFIGWGKPVNTNPSRLRFGLNGLAIVALAGPFSNIVFAVVLAAVAVFTAQAVPAVAEFAAQGVNLSIYLAIFNLLPVPPLDGSKLLLAARIPWVIYDELARFGFLLLIVAMTVSDLGRWMATWSFEASRTLFRVFA